MPFRAVTHGTNQQFINNIPIVDQEYNLSVDTDRPKSKQVKVTVINNNEKYNSNDSLQHFLNKLSSNNSSLFNLLEQEKKISELAKYETPNSAKQTRKAQRNRKRNRNRSKIVNTRRVKRNRK